MLGATNDEIQEVALDDGDSGRQLLRSDRTRAGACGPTNGPPELMAELPWRPTPDLESGQHPYGCCEVNNGHPHIRVDWQIVAHDCYSRNANVGRSQADGFGKAD